MWEDVNPGRRPALDRENNLAYSIIKRVRSVSRKYLDGGCLSSLEDFQEVTGFDLIPVILQQSELDNIEHDARLRPTKAPLTLIVDDACQERPDNVVVCFFWRGRGGLNVCRRSQLHSVKDYKFVRVWKANEYYYFLEPLVDFLERVCSSI